MSNSPLSSPQAQQEAPPPRPVIPEGGVIYKVNSSNASFGELWRDVRSPMVLIVWLTKLLRVRLPGSVNDPNVESLHPFEVIPGEIPQEVRAKMEPLVRELAALGFESSAPDCHAIVDLFNNSRLYLMTLPRADGQAAARVQLRTEGTSVPPKMHLFCDFLTETEDGGFICSSNARATMDAPAGIDVHAQFGMPTKQLWTAHQSALQRATRDGRRPLVYARGQMRQMIDRHHERIREFHLRRGVFQAMSGTDQTTAAALDASFSQGTADGFAYPDVLAEMERIQNKSTNWTGGVIVLLVSLLFFITIGLGGDEGENKWEVLLLLVPILFIHELGHYLAMRIFGYRNLKMFFIPMFGAAVSGTHYTAPGWKKVIVALMGPLPGIALGAAIGIAGIVLKRPLMIQAGFLALFLNGLNLLPVLPLDGGRVMQSLLFSRHYALDLLFRVAAALALLSLSAVSGDRALLVVGIFMIVGLPAAWKLGRIAADLKNRGIIPTASEDHRIQPQVAQQIIERVKAAFPRGPARHNKATAQNSLAVYELISSRPPGWLASIGFAILHAGGLVMAVLLALVMVIAQGGDLGGFVRAAAAQPQYPISREHVARADGGPLAIPASAPTTAAAAARRSILADFTKPAGANDAFNTLKPGLQPGETMLRFGQTLLVFLERPTDDARRKWVQDLELRTKQVQVEDGLVGVSPLRLTCLAPTEAVAREMIEELEDYFGLPAEFHLAAPWMKERSALEPAERSRQQVARRTFLRLNRAGASAYQAPEMIALAKEMGAAQRRGEKSEVERIQKEREAFIKQSRDREIDALKGVSDGSVDLFIVAEFLKIPPRDDEDFDSLKYDQAPFPGMAARMGQIAFLDQKPAPRADRYSAHFGAANRNGLLISFEWVRFVDASEGAVALIDWLEARNCRSMRYSFMSAIFGREDLQEP